MTERVRALLADRSTRIAIVGASAARNKYGNIVLRNLRAKGFTVFPVNPSASLVEGEKAYASVAQIPGRVDIVNFVVPPEVSLEILEALDASKVEVVWFQPGAYDGQVVARARAAFAHVLAGECIMTEAW